MQPERDWFQDLDRSLLLCQAAVAPDLAACAAPAFTTHIHLSAFSWRFALSLVPLQAEGVELESAGGGVQLVRTASPSGIGLAELEEALLLQVLRSDFSQLYKRSSTHSFTEGALAHKATLT